MMSRWEVLFWMGLAVLLALVPWVTERKPKTPVDQWADVYRTCVGSYPTDQQRAECIAAADRVLCCCETDPEFRERLRAALGVK